MTDIKWTEAEITAQRIANKMQALEAEYGEVESIVDALTAAEARIEKLSELLIAMLVFHDKPPNDQSIAKCRLHDDVRAALAAKEVE